MRESTAENARVFEFDDAADLAAAVPAGIDYWDRRWVGESEDAARDGARVGRTDLVAEAERILEQVAARVESPRTEWTRSPVGAYPVVPEALQGHPDPMRRRTSASDDRAPLRVWVDLVSSAGIPDGHLRRRGVAALALAMALSAERAVEVHAAMSLGSRQRLPAVLTFPVATAPLDLARACYALTSSGLCRGLGHTFGRAKNDFDGSWAWLMPENDAKRAQYVEQFRKAVGAAPADFVLPPTWLNDPAAADPVEWVRRSVEEHLAREENS